MAKCAKTIKEEIQFLKLVHSFGRTISNDLSPVTSTLYTKKLIVLLHVLFISLIITDIILTNLCSTSVFPLYTSTIKPLFQWQFMHSTSLIVYILFCVGMIGACCCCCICCFSETFICCRCLQRAVSSNTYSFLYEVCISICCVVMISTMIIIAYILLLMMIFCLSPPLVLYMVFLFYIFTNSSKITLLKYDVTECELCDTAPLLNHNILTQSDNICRVLNTISNGYKFGIIHRRLAQYLIAYIIWPLDDIQYDYVQIQLLEQIKLLFKMDVYQALHELNDARNIFNELTNVNDCKVRQKLFSVIHGNRMWCYGAVCFALYIVVVTIFWLCYWATSFAGDSRVLFTFYTTSYCLYFIFLFVIICLLWTELKLYIFAKYEWLFRIFYSGRSEDGIYTFDENEFLSFYCIICHQYITYQCLKRLFHHRHEWMVTLILKYLMNDDFKWLINVYGRNINSDKALPEEYFYDPVLESNAMSIMNCIQKQNQQLQDFLSSYEDIHQNQCIVVKL